jgi:hypothetical protein
MNSQAPGTMPGQVSQPGMVSPQGAPNNSSQGHSMVGNSIMGNLNANLGRMSFQVRDWEFICVKIHIGILVLAAPLDAKMNM